MINWNSAAISNVISSFAFLISAISLYQAWKIGERESRNKKDLDKIRSEKLLAEALDLMNMGKVGTESLIIEYHKPPSAEERAYFNRAFARIKEAKYLTPNFYLCHQYEGIYVQRTKGIDPLERAQNALEPHLKAVQLWEKDTDSSVKDDGWPYHDLATAYHNLYIYKREESCYEAAIFYYGKALDIEKSEPYFYGDYAVLEFNKGNSEKYKELYRTAKKVSKSTGKEFVISHRNKAGLLRMREKSVE